MTLPLDQKKLLLRMPNWIGDLVMATPLIEAIKNAYPSCEISALVPAVAAPLLKAHPYLKKVIPAPCLRGLWPSKAALQCFQSVKKHSFDCLVLTTHSFSSAMQGYLMGIPCRLGFKNECRGMWLTKSLAFPKEKDRQHLVNTYMSLLEPFGIHTPSQAPQLYLSPSLKDWASSFLNDLGVEKRATLIGINPGAAYGSAKCWPPERFSKVAQVLSQSKGNTLLFFGSKDQEDLVRKICEQQNKRVINLAGKTKLEELCALIQHCDIMLSNDSGPMHLSYALQTPVVALFGSTCEIKTGPYNMGRVIHKHVSCSPCFLRRCPIDFRCMKGISPEEVILTLQQFLKETKGKSVI